MQKIRDALIPDGQCVTLDFVPQEDRVSPPTAAAFALVMLATARAGTAMEAAQAGDLVVVSVPLRNYRAVPAEPLAGKIVIDTMFRNAGLLSPGFIY